MTIFWAIILLATLIFIHELGHFILAKLTRVKVLKFSLGFGPRLIGRKIGETDYIISAIPFGGYVKMLGEEPGEELKEENKARSFKHQPVLKRMGIVFAGPVFNILFAFFLLSVIYGVGMPVLIPEVGKVVPNSPSEKAGIMKGDKIFGINNVEIKRWDELSNIIHNSAGKKITLKIRRAEEVLTVEIIPEKKVVKNIFGEEKEIGLIGIGPSGQSVLKRESLINAVMRAFQKTWEIIVVTVIAVVKLIQRVIPANTIGGPILILQMAGKQASAGLLDFFIFMAIISVNLGILNLLPIPVLDGGHILFLSIEGIRKKPLRENTLMIAQKVGLLIIIAIMTFALYNDLIRLIIGEVPWQNPQP